MLIRFLGFARAGVPYASGSQLPWTAGDVREVEEAEAAILLVDFADCGPDGGPCFAEVKPEKPAPVKRRKVVKAKAPKKAAPKKQRSAKARG